MSRVTIITTQEHNVGDDFVREGIVYLLRQILKNPEFKLIHKHLPITVRPELSWMHAAPVEKGLDKVRPGFALHATSKLDQLLPVFPWSDKVTNSDILVQSGAPIYWTNPDNDCDNTEWWGPLIERRWLKGAAGRPFLNLAGGTCQKWSSDGSEFADKPKVLEHIRRFYDLTALTTLRDELSTVVLKMAGRTAEKLPCTSIFAIDEFGIKPSKGEFVVFNYMPTGGHYLFGQPIDGERWERAFVTFIKQTAAKTKCIIACHNEKELNAAKRLLPGIETFFSTHHKDFLQLYSRARWGLMNRVHGAFALASLGKPASIVGSDSRARMGAMIGLRSVFVNDATPEWLEEQGVLLEQECPTTPARMEELKAKTKARYLELLETALSSKSVKR